MSCPLYKKLLATDNFFSSSVYSIFFFVQMVKIGDCLIATFIPFKWLYVSLNILNRIGEISVYVWSERRRHGYASSVCISPINFTTFNTNENKLTMWRYEMIMLRSGNNLPAMRSNRKKKYQNTRDMHFFFLRLLVAVFNSQLIVNYDCGFLCRVLHSIRKKIDHRFLTQSLDVLYLYT